MADKKISQLNTATTVYDADDFALVQDGETKQTNASTVKAYVKNGLSKSDVGLGNVDNTSDATKNSAAVTLTNKTLTSPVISGGTANNVAIGGTAPAAGAFTNLSYTGTLTGGTGVLNIGSGQIYKNTSGNVGIGTSAPATALDVLGAQFDGANSGNIRSIDNTTLGANKGGGVLFGGYYTGTVPTIWAAISGLKESATSGEYGGYLILKTRAHGEGLHERFQITPAGTLLLRQSSNAANTSVSLNTTVQNALILDASGNLGVKVTPNAWTGNSVLQLGQVGWVRGDTGSCEIGNNAYSESGTWKYQISSYSTRYLQNSGSHYWYVANLGTAGAAITFTTAMVLNLQSCLGIGTTAFGSSAGKVLAIGNGVAPTTGPADTIQLYSTDLSAGNTMLSLYTEGTCVNENTTAATTHRIAVRINGTVYYLLANTAA